jgi:hypothetical protein
MIFHASNAWQVFHRRQLLKIDDSLQLTATNYCGCRSPIRCARHEKDFFLFGASSSVWDCRLFVDRRKMLVENVNRALAGLQGKAFGHQKMAVESTLPPHNEGAARRVLERIESCFHAQSEFL